MSVTDANQFSQIRNQFKQVIEHSQSFEPNDEAIKELFHSWYLNKMYFIHNYLHDDYIYEYGTVELHLDSAKKDLLFEEFINQVGYAIDDYALYEQVANFMHLNKNGFFTNTIVHKDSSRWSSSIKPGMKLMRCLKYIIKKPELLTEIQQLASSYIQQDKIKGTLCFSVHPLDYLSISETTYNWRSCHALNGDYRAGNLSYMGDISTIICYLKGEDNVKLPNFPENVLWNSKKWRMLIFMDEHDEHCMLGRQYPFTTEGILPIIQDFLNSHHYNSGNKWLNFTNHYTTFVRDENLDNEGYIPLAEQYMTLQTTPHGMRLLGIHEVVQDESDLHYNDLLRSSSYIKPYYSSNGRPHSPHAVKIRIGYESKCLYCGNDPIKGDGAGVMVCEDCEEKLNLNQDGQYCDICGNFIHFGESFVVTQDGTVACYDCIDNCNVLCCESCNMWFLAEDMVYDEENDKYYCKDCFYDE